MSITIKDDSVSGSGWYEKYKILFPISGEVVNGHINIREFAGQNNGLSGILRGKFVSDKRLEGTYSKPDSSKGHRIY